MIGRPGNACAVPAAEREQFLALRQVHHAVMVRGKRAFVDERPFLPIPLPRVGEGGVGGLETLSLAGKVGKRLPLLQPQVIHMGAEIGDVDGRILKAIIENFDGGPVGVDSLSAAIGEERGTIEDVLEPYLIQQGFMMRTARGRVATANAYRHFGLTPPAGESSPGLPLFDQD